MDCHRDVTRIYAYGEITAISATNYYEPTDSAALRGGRFKENVIFDSRGPKAMADYVYTALDNKLGGLLAGFV